MEEDVAKLSLATLNGVEDPSNEIVVRVRLGVAGGEELGIHRRLLVVVLPLLEAQFEGVDAQLAVREDVQLVLLRSDSKGADDSLRRVASKLTHLIFCAR